jgi:hypothetical protein
MLNGGESAELDLSGLEPGEPVITSNAILLP